FVHNTPLPTALHPLSLHDALPISQGRSLATDQSSRRPCCLLVGIRKSSMAASIAMEPSVINSRNAKCSKTKPRSIHIDAAKRKTDRKSTRLNSSHVSISYAVFCLK